MSSQTRRDAVLRNIKFRPYNPHAYKKNPERTRTAGNLSYRQGFVMPPIIKNKANHGANSVDMVYTTTIKKFESMLLDFKMWKKMNKKSPGSFAEYIKNVKSGSRLFIMKQNYISLNKFPKYVLRGVMDRIHQLFIGSFSFHIQAVEIYQKNNCANMIRIPDNIISNLDRINIKIDNHLLQITQPCVILMRFIRICKSALAEIDYTVYFKTAKHILKLCKSYIKTKNAFLSALKSGKNIRNPKFYAFASFPRKGGLLSLIQSVNLPHGNGMYKMFIAHENITLNVKEKQKLPKNVSHRYKYTNFSKIL
jgi:hypothetical protein